MLISNNLWFAFPLALFAGIISSFSPCVLSSLPLIVGYVQGNAEKDRKKSILFSMFFCLGLILTFTALGTISALIGRIVAGTGTWWYIFLGIIMLVVGLELIGVINIMPRVCKIPGNKNGIMGAFLLGILGGALSSPCATPVLVAILTFVAAQSNVILGALLLFIYSIGHCALIFLAGASIGLVQKLADSPTTQKVGKLLKIILGIVILLIGFFLFYIS